MRKDVRTGAVIGGLLIAVLILYGVVASRSHKKPGGEPVALGTEKNVPDVPGDHPDGTPTAPDATPAPAGDATVAGSGTGAPVTPPPGADLPNPAGPKPDSSAASKTGVSWAALLRADNVENLMPVQSQTPDPTAMDAGAHTGSAHPAVAEAPRPSPKRSAPDNNDSATASGSSPSSDAPLAPTASTSYTVKSGDTLSSIARATYGDARYYKKIMAANPKLNPNRMRAGAVIILPGRSQIAHESATSDAVMAASDSPAHRSAPKAAAPVDSSTEYRVVSNDSLYRISMKLYHTPNKVDLIYQFNKTLIGADPARLKLGMVLKLPEPPTQTASTR